MCTNAALLVRRVHGYQYVRQRSTRTGMDRDFLFKSADRSAQPHGLPALARGQDPATTKDCFNSSFRAWHPEFTVPYEQADSLSVQGYAGELSSFADAVLARRPVSPSIEDGVAAMRIVEAIAAAPDGLNVLSLT